MKVVFKRFKSWTWLKNRFWVLNLRCCWFLRFQMKITKCKPVQTIDFVARSIGNYSVCAPSDFVDVYSIINRSKVENPTTRKQPKQKCARANERMGKHIIHITITSPIKALIFVFIFHFLFLFSINRNKIRWTRRINSHWDAMLDFVLVCSVHALICFVQLISHEIRRISKFCSTWCSLTSGALSIFRRAHSISSNDVIHHIVVSQMIILAVN